jgi:hypothetical protein
MSFVKIGQTLVNVHWIKTIKYVPPTTSESDSDEGFDVELVEAASGPKTLVFFVPRDDPAFYVMKEMMDNM